MDLYLSNCYKAAEAAATKAAASRLTADREQCDTGSHKKTIPEVGAANLLDLPLGVKLPIIPGSNNVFYTTNISEKLYQPSFDFNLSDPYCRLLETSYKSLHDPHLKAYHKRKDILRRLKKGGYITSNNKKMIEKQVNKLHETRRAYDNYGNAHFQEWLLQEGTQATPDQELIIKHRYLDMISRELDKVEHTAEKQSILRMKEEEQQHQDHIRRKLGLRRQIEEEWKTKEMLLLTKIGEEVKREERIEEQHKKAREEAHRKKQALLEKRITYHLQKIQKDDLKKDKPEGNIFENKGRDEKEGQHSHTFVKIPAKKSSVFISSQHDIQKNKTEQKKDKEMTKTAHTLSDEGIKNNSLQAPGVSAKTANVPRHSIQTILKQEVTYADSNDKRAKKSSFTNESAQGVFPSYDSSIRQQNGCQEKAASRNSFQNLIKPDITKVELLKDVHSKKDLIIRLVTHDIGQEVSENKVEEGLTSNEDEVVLQNVVKEELPEDLFDDQAKEEIKPIMGTVALHKPLISKRNLKKFLSLGKCCHRRSTVTTTNTEASPTLWTESEETQQRLVSNTDVTTSKSPTGTDSSFWERKTQLSREEMKASTESAYYLHRIMSSSSYNEEDLPSFSSDDDDRPSDPSAKITEESFEFSDMENASSIKFITLYQRESALASLCPSSDGTSDADKPSTSKQGSEMMKKGSSALSKVFSRSNANVLKSSSPSPPQQDRS